MKPSVFSRRHIRTDYVQLDTGKCKACWKCIEACPNGVIGKIDLPWHKHALITASDHCTGCFSCVNVCLYGAYSTMDGMKPMAEKQRERLFKSFLTNNLLLISGFIMILSGLTLQLGFHAGGPDVHQRDAYNIGNSSVRYEEIRLIDTSKTILNFNYADWSTIHKSVIVLFSLLMAYHIYVHWKWYKEVIKKHMIGKNFQVFIVTVLFLLVAATGLIPWFIDLSGGNSVLRFILIEIHDKLALLLLVFLILHISKRNRWFSRTYAKLNNE
ncbi:MAG TPA: ferredoxin family protein [Bacteroidales bacterium]